MVTVEKINGLYIIVNDGVHRFMNDSTLEQIICLNAGDDIELDVDELAEYWELID